MNINQAAIVLHWTPRKIRRMIDKKQLPAIRVGRDTYINLEDLDRWRKRETALRTH